MDKIVFCIDYFLSTRLKVRAALPEKMKENSETVFIVFIESVSPQTILYYEAIKNSA
jgi:hypothetical protein